MMMGKTVLAIITARGGSKEIPRKNIKCIYGKPLIAWTILEAKKSVYIDRLIISTDNSEIANIAKKYGCEVPFIRPKNLAKDTTPSINVVLHTINKLRTKYDYICLLQPTSPLRKKEQIDNALEIMHNKKVNSLAGVCKAQKTPYWMIKIDKNNMTSFILRSKAARRQDLPIIYQFNGAIYLATMKFLIKNKTFITKNTFLYEMDKISSIDIDDQFDFFVAEQFLKAGNETK